jgi:dienelactone hydrolase
VHETIAEREFTMSLLKPARSLLRTAVCAAAVACTAAAHAAAPRVLPAGTLPADGRLEPPRSVNSYHPFHPISSAAEWTERREAIRRRVLVAAGLWPMPRAAASPPQFRADVDCGDHVVTGVVLESFPGHFVTGSLYRPKGPPPPGGRPGVLCPHGHWPKGRFLDVDPDKIAAEIASGGESRPEAARSPLQARCVQLARMGCTVFLYDMVGYADSVQFAGHRASPRAELDLPEPGGWGFAGAQAGLRLQSIFGLQTFNSLRVLDFLTALDGVDPKRILVTGASGGGTQTMMLAAIDDRVAASFPCVMVSTGMQGGCPCENASVLRIGQGNIDIAAAAAPRPQGLTAADDWTRELKTKGWPDLERLYALLSAPGAVEAHFDIRFPHNYNEVARNHMYAFANRHLGLGLAEPIRERGFSFLTSESLTVWDAAHPAPAGAAAGVEHERDLCHRWAVDTAGQVALLLDPADPPALRRCRDVVGAGWQVLVGRNPPPADTVRGVTVDESRAEGIRTLKLLVRNVPRREELPVVALVPDRVTGGAVIVASPDGKDGLFVGVEPRPEVARLLAAGRTVVGADLFGQGEFRREAGDFVENTRVPLPGGTEPWRLDPVYSYGYNDSLFARRTHDLVTLAAWVRSQPLHAGDELGLVGLAGAGHWATAARAVLADGPSPVRLRAVIDTGGFRFRGLRSPWHADFQPGAVALGDLPALLVLGGPGPLWLAGESPAIVATLRRAAAFEGGRAVVAAADSGGESWADFFLTAP